MMSLASSIQGSRLQSPDARIARAGEHASLKIDNSPQNGGKFICEKAPAPAPS